MLDRQEETVSAERSKDMKEFLARFVSNELGEAQKTLKSLQPASPHAGRAMVSALMLHG